MPAPIPGGMQFFAPNPLKVPLIMGRRFVLVTPPGSKLTARQINAASLVKSRIVLPNVSLFLQRSHPPHAVKEGDSAKNWQIMDRLHFVGSALQYVRSALSECSRTF